MTFNDLTREEKAFVLQVYGNVAMENPDVTLAIVTQCFMDRKMKKEYKLYNVSYRMNMRGGFQNDVWCIFGDCPERPNFPNGVFISTPVECDEVKKTIRTYSGSLYHIESFSCDEAKFWEQVKKDITNGNYEHH